MRLINADALYKTIDQEADFYGGFGDNVITASELRRCIEMVPTIDAVPVVRCRECKFSQPWYADKSRCFLWHESGIDVFNDGYCSYGKRKEDET